jgi:phospholipid/cholesterol/gamma-HCH transport system permease protein
MTGLVLERHPPGWRLRLTGLWSLDAVPAVESELKALTTVLDGDVECDWSGAAEPGIGPAWVLLHRLAGLNPDGHAITHTGAPRLLDFLQKLHDDRHPEDGERTVPAGDGALGALGRWTLAQGIEARGAVGFFGGIVMVLREAFTRPGALRLPSLIRHIHETGITAIPIVSLIAFLISVIVAYLGAQQLSRFGANIFVVDLVTISVLREMGVLLTSIIVAGRSGSAFAAELGVMQLNEETDALRAMGMNPIEVLVVPRVLALMIALPLLTVIADAMGLAGGGLLSLVNLHIPLPQFTSRLRESLAPTTFWSGLVKAPVFALLIGMVGAYRGMQVRESARELGRLTTVAVVQSIFMVIFADALFAVLFVQIDF